MRNPFKRGVRYWCSKKRQTWHAVVYRYGAALSDERCLRARSDFTETDKLPPGAKLCKRCLGARIP